MPLLRHRTTALAAPLLATLWSVGATPAGAAPASAATTSCQVAAAGDIAGDDYRTGAARTAALITDAQPEKVLAVGDLAYDSGTVQEFEDHYQPTWGAFRADTEAVPGNHEGASSAGFRRTFGARQLENRGVDVCGWRVVLVNQYLGVREGAAFVTAEAAAHPDQPLVVMWHAPRWSSGSEHGSDASVQPLWAAAARAGARIVLNGHDHDYERFQPMTASGAVSATGTRQFVTGLGGHHVRGWGSTEAHSAKRFTGTPAVLFLTLDADGSYAWAERTASGTTVDSGTAAAPGGSSPAPSPTSTATPTATPTADLMTGPTTGVRSAGTPLRVSRHADRSGSEVVPADGSLVVSGEVYFSVPAAGTREVTVGVDAWPVTTERHRPFDAMGTGPAPQRLARPLDTRQLANGEHTIVVDGVRPDRAPTTYTFTVEN